MNNSADSDNSDRGFVPAHYAFQRVCYLTRTRKSRGVVAYPTVRKDFSQFPLCMTSRQTREALHELQRRGLLRCARQGVCLI